eukprot:tig00020557_g11112.t1
MGDRTRKRAASPSLDTAPPKPKKGDSRRLIVVLESAQLETVKAGKEFQLLNCDDHQHIFRKTGRDPALSRPDITHQCLLTLLDSPLNKAGMLQIFIHTDKNVLIEVNPQIRIPRTFKRFCGLFVQLLHKLSIRATNGPEKLLKVVQNPVTKYLPTGAPRIGCSFSAQQCVRLRDWVPTLPDGPVVFVVGAFAHGKIEADYVDQQIAFSEYPLSASVAVGKLCCAFEDQWGVL